jgi:hypothetical protein
MRCSQFSRDGVLSSQKEEEVTRIPARQLLFLGQVRQGGAELLISQRLLDAEALRRMDGCHLWAAFKQRHPAGIV